MTVAARHICPHCHGDGWLERLPLTEAVLGAQAEALRHACSAMGGLVTGDGRTDERHAAMMLGLAPKTLSNWRHTHRPIPFAKRRGRVLYAFADLARFLAQNDGDGEK